MICDTCKHYVIDKCMVIPGSCEGTTVCPKYESIPYVEMKDEHECSDFNISISARICALCKAITNNSTRKRFDAIRMWALEILQLNEVNRNLERQSKEKVFYEEDIK